jgi:selenocysteine lyase/cysteine desulfurase
VPDVTVHDLGPRPAAIVSFSSATEDADAVMHRLAAAKINVATSIPSSTLLDATARRLPDLVRASPHYYNTEDEVDALVAALAAAR